MLSYFEASRFPHRTNPHSHFPSNISRRTVAIQRKDRCSTTSHLLSHRSKQLRLTSNSIGSKLANTSLSQAGSFTSNALPPKPEIWNVAAGWTRYSADGISSSVPYPDEQLFVLTSKQCHHITTTRSWLEQHPLAHGIAGYLAGY